MKSGVFLIICIAIFYFFLLARMRLNQSDCVGSVVVFPKRLISLNSRSYTKKKLGFHIDIQGGGATRGIREVASITADVGGSCRNKIFGEPAEAGVTIVRCLISKP